MLTLVTCFFVAELVAYLVALAQADVLPTGCSDTLQQDNRFCASRFTHETNISYGMADICSSQTDCTNRFILGVATIYEDNLFVDVAARAGGTFTLVEKVDEFDIRLQLHIPDIYQVGGTPIFVPNGAEKEIWYTVEASVIVKSIYGEFSADKYAYGYAFDGSHNSSNLAWFTPYGESENVKDGGVVKYTVGIDFSCTATYIESEWRFTGIFTFGAVSAPGGGNVSTSTRKVLFEKVIAFLPPYH